MYVAHDVSHLASWSPGCVPVTWLAISLQVGRVSRPEGWGNVPWLSLGKKQPNEKDQKVTWHIHFLTFFLFVMEKIWANRQITSAWQFMPITHSIARRRRSQSQVLHERERKPLGWRMPAGVFKCVCVFDWFQFETSEVISESYLECICICNLTVT